MNTFHLTIRTPEKDVFAADLKSLTLNSDMGMMQVLPHHASITTTLGFSPLRLVMNDGEESFIARNGMFLFNNRTNSGLLLALNCAPTGEIDRQGALEYLAFLKDQLAKGSDLSEFQVKYLEGEKFAVERQVTLTK
jgi:F0F1-type ATP synthase epsilon subunit